MFGLSESTVYYMCQHPVDMRNGINGLYKLVRSEMKMSPLTGSVFIFYGKNHQSVKLLRWDTDGFVLYQKRLEKGTFEIPKFDEATGGYRMPWKTFSLIMQGVRWSGSSTILKTRAST